MACFLVPTAEAIVVGAITIAVKAKEKKVAPKTFNYQAPDGSILTGETVKLSRKLGWLLSLLFGGAVLLAYEHVWHGEVVPWFPFLTAASNAADTQAMLHEMGTAGVSMAVIVTVVWVGMVVVSSIIEKKAIKSKTSKKVTA